MEHTFRRIYKNFTKVLAVGFILISAQLFYSNFGLKVEAAINNTINFQSKIVNKSTGLNITAGTPACVKAGADTCDFQIRIWNDPTGTSTTAGSGNLMFTQTFQDIEIGDTNGTFNLVINSCGSTVSGNSQWGTSTGTCTVVDDSDSDSDAGVNFDRQDLYIEIAFAPTDTSGSLGSFSELFNRTSLKSVPSAFVAQTLSGIGANGFVQVSPSATQTITSTNSLINLTSTATGATNPLITVNENGTGTPDLLDLKLAGSSVFNVNNSGALGIGTTSSNAALAVSRTYTNTSGFLGMQYNTMTLNPSSSSTATLITSWNQAFTGSGNANTINRIVGLYNQAIHQGTNTLSTATGLLNEIKVDSTGSITNAVGGEFNAQLTGGGNVNTLRNLYVNNATVGAGSITDNYGLYIVNQTSGTNDYGIYVAGADTYSIWSASGANRFDGNVLAGTTTNTAFLNVAASTSAQASLRLISSGGTDPSSPNSGDLWWNGTSLNFKTASSTVDLLAAVGGGSYVNFISGSTQSTTSTNSLIDLTSTATGATNPLIVVNENGSGTPNLLDLKVASSSKFTVNNSGGIISLSSSAIGPASSINMTPADYASWGSNTFANTLSLGSSPTSITTDFYTGLMSSINLNTSGNTTGQITGIDSHIYIPTSNNNNFQSIVGLSSTVFPEGTGTINTLIGGQFEAVPSDWLGASTLDAYGLKATTGGATRFQYGGYFTALNTLDSDTTMGLYGSASSFSTTASSTYGLYGYARSSANVSTGTNNVYGVYSELQIQNATNNTSNAYGFYSSLNVDAGTSQNAYGLFINNITGAVNNYGVYVIGAGTYAFWADSGVSRFDGGVIAPSGSLSNLPYSFSDDLTTGIYGDGAGKINFASSGTTIFSLNGTVSAGFNIGRIDFQPGSSGTPSINFGDINTGLFKATTNELGFSNNGVESLRLTAAGNAQFANNVLVGTTTNTAFLNVAASTTAKASLRLVSSAGTDPSSPNSGDLWWNGTSLKFKTTSSTIDLVNGYVQFASGSTQTSTNTNALINIATSGNVSSTLFTLNENGAGTPDLFQLQTGGATRFLVNNSGAVAVTPAAGTANPFSVSASFTSTGGANQALSLTATQTVATLGSVDSFLLTPVANVASGSVGGMNGLLARVTTGGGVTVVGARGFSTWANIGSGTTVNDLYNFDVLNPVNNGTIGNNFGLRIDNLTAGTNDYGIYIAGADTYAIWSASGANRFDGRTGFGGAPNTNDQVTITGTVNASSGLAAGLRLTNNLTATANSQALAQLLVSPTYTGGGFTNLTKSALLIQTNSSDAAAMIVETVSGQSTVIDIRDSIGFTMASVSGIGRISGEGFTGLSSSNTRLIATGTTAGSGNNGSIYFLDSSGTTRGRFDTAKTVLNSFDGDGADGAINISTPFSINTTPIATGRVTYADGIAYRVNPPSVGDTSVTRFRSGDTISNGLTAGDDVLLINLQGNTPVATNNASIDTASVGNHEILTIASVSASTITFTTPVKGRYVGLNSSNQRVVIQRVPNYTTVTLNNGATITASAYDGLSTVPSGGAGYFTGIVAFKATGAVTVNTGATITTSSQGFRGGAAGASGANGGFNGESYDIVGNNTAGRGGSGASNGETWGGGRSSNGAVAATGNGTYRGGGGGGGSNGSASTGDDGSGAGGGGGYGGGGGGGGGGSNRTAGNGGAGGTGGDTEVAAGGGAGAQNTAAAGVAGGNAGSAGTSATGAGGAVGNGQLGGSGGAGAALTTSGGAGGGGGGIYGDPMLRNLFYGSGGGGGAGGFSVNTAGAAGGQGGGIIHILANSISLPGTGTIQANGAAGTNGTAPASGGGGGAGGSISLQANTISLGSGLVTATGGAVGSVAARRGASGAGGVGRIYYEYITSQSGTTTPTATVAQITNNYGTLYVGDINTSEADLAEYYITGDRSIEAGDVVSISPYRVANNNNEEVASQGVLRKTERAYDSKLIGVISTAPGITLGSKDASTGAPDNRALALKGRVPVKIDPDSEPISIGDYLTSSVKPGYAKKATEPGYVLGKALEYWNSNLNKKSISVFIDLGYYYGGNSTTQEALNLSSQSGLAISGYSLPSKVVSIISKATDGQVLGTSTDSTSTNTSVEEPTQSVLESEIKLALGTSELSDYYQTNDSSITTGDVIKFDDNQLLSKAGGSELRGDKDISGVISTQPNIFLSGQMDSESNRTVTMGGKVVLKVTDINGPIKKGDYLAASDIPGYAMKADNANGVVLGRALEDFPLSLNPDSAMVRRELTKNKEQAINMISDLVRNGKFTVEDSNKYSEIVNNYYSESTINNVEGKVAGRIMAYVNIGYMAEGMMLPKNTNLADGSIPGSNGTMHSAVDDLINAIKNTDLTLNNILTVKNVIEAQTYQNITGLDLAFKITSANNSFRVLDINNESLIAVDQNGKITLKEGNDSSVGEVIFPPQTSELFIENKSVTEKSKIYLTPSEFVFSKVRAINPGYGFTIELQNVMDKEIKVNYLIIN